MERNRWYREVYLQSSHWKTFSRKQLAKRLICEECLRAPATELHHRRYYDERGRSILGREQPYDMTAICRPCHTEIEEFKRQQRGERKSLWTTIFR